MAANVRITQVLLKRGNTAAASNYTGPVGEVVIDTGLRTLRIQDGITPGGSIITANSSAATITNATVTNGNLIVTLSNSATINAGNVTGPQGAPGSITGWTVDASNNLNPNTDNLQDIGTPSLRVRHIYVGPGSITVGSAVITEASTGKLVLPGLTRGTGFSIDDVEDTDNQTYSFNTTPLIIDNAYYAILNGATAPAGYSAPEYSVDQLDDDGFIDGINIDSQGSGLTQTEVNLMRQNMWAYVGSDNDPIGNWDSADWVGIPFRVKTEAGDVEYEFESAGATALDELSDTDISDLSTGEALVWDGENWTNQTISGNGFSGDYNDLTNTPSIPSSLTDLNNVNITSPITGQVLKYNGTSWINGTDNAGGQGEYAGTLSISETDPGTGEGTLWFNPVDGQTYIKYNDQWIETTPALIPGNMVAYESSGNVELRDDANLVFPDSTTQTTAFNTYVGNTAPASGLIWYNTEDGRTYNRVNGLWVDASPAVLPGDVVTFNDDGNVTLPVGGQVTWANGRSILHGIAGSNYGNTQVAAYLATNPQQGTYSDSNVAAYLWHANLDLTTVNFTASPIAYSAPGIQWPGGVFQTTYYGNTQVAAYLPTYSGNIASNIAKNGYTWSFAEDGTTTFPSNTIKTASSLSIQTLSSTPASVANWNGGGGWNQGFYSNIATTGGTGTGLTVDVTTDGSGYINIEAITINTPGSGYTDGDVITIENENTLTGTFTVGVTANNWTLDATGDLTFPDNTVQTTAYVKTTGTWAVTTGNNTYSFTVPTNGVYQLWVRGNIPNGIITYSATAVVTNPNVPVLGNQSGWYYLAGNALVLTSIPTQFVGTDNTISNAAPSVGTTTNVFEFGITNNSGETQSVEWGYTKL